YVCARDAIRQLYVVDLSGVVTQADAADETPPLSVAGRWAAETTTMTEAAWIEEDGWVYVLPVNLLREVRGTGAFVLPTSNPKGVISLLEDQHHGELVQVRRGSKLVRAVRIPITELN